MSLTTPDRAHYFDGDTPAPFAVDPRIEGGELVIALSDGRDIRWPVKDIRRLPDSAAKTNAILRWTGDPVARLILKEPKLLRALPRLTRRAPPKGRGRLAAWALGAVAAVVVQVFVLVPLLADNLAGFIPPRGERALGEATLGHIRAALDSSGLGEIPVCEAPDGRVALDALTARLTEGTKYADGLSVLVLDHPMVNAFALPGGYVVLFDGLIAASEGPDGVTAVLAHEIGHVASRDPTRNALRSAGSIGVLGLLLGDFAGGAVVLMLSEQLISAQYSQAAEAGADAFAHEMLEDAGINPGALGDMFETLRNRYGDRNGLQAHFLSHPSLGSRIDAAQAAVDQEATYTASMSPEDWKALQGICGGSAKPLQPERGQGEDLLPPAAD